MNEDKILQNMDKRYGAPLGYLFDFTIYEGRTGREVNNMTNFAVGAGVVLDIIYGLSVDSDSNLKPMFLSVDNLFNSFQMIDHCPLRNVPIRHFESRSVERNSHLK